MTMISTGDADRRDVLDDRGTTQTGGREIIRELRDQGFDGSDDGLALALGRPVEEVTGLIDGSEPVDDDVLMKARAIAQQRGVDVERTNK